MRQAHRAGVRELGRKSLFRRRPLTPAPLALVLWPKALSPRAGKGGGAALASLILVAPMAPPRLRRRLARRLGQAEVAEGVGGEHAPARGALHEAFLDQIRLDDVLDGVARLGQRRRDSLDPDRTAAEGFRDQ